MAGTVIADRLEAAVSSQLVIENGVALTPPTIVDVNNVAIGTFCRAWVYFNGTGTVAIVGSFNVSSITDNGTGDYTINITNALPDGNYAVTGAGTYIAAGQFTTIGTVSTTTTAARIVTWRSFTSTTVQDSAIVGIAIFR